MTDSTTHKTIPYWKLTTFNEKLNASIALLKEYWKPLLRANVMISGPFFIIGVGIILFYFNVFIQNLVLEATDQTSLLVNQLFFYFFIGGLLYGLSMLSIILVTFEVIRLQKNDPDNINNLSLIAKNAAKKFWKFIGILLLTLFALVLGNIALFIAGALVALLTLGLGILLLYPAQFFFYIIFYSLLYILLPLAFFEKNSIKKSFLISRKYLRNSFWPTAGMYIGTKAIQFVLVNGLSLPIITFLFYTIFRGIDGVGSDISLFTENKLIFNLSMILLFFYLLINLASNIFHVVTSAVQYFTLKEEHESSFVFQQIEQFQTLGE